MNKKYYKQAAPFRVPTGDNKIIDEHFGKASYEAGDYSVASMIAPPGWIEPFQIPQFDEITLVFEGRKMVEIEGEKITLEPNESILVKSGTRVRYSNPFNEECRYVSFCIPAFTIARVNRE